MKYSAKLRSRQHEFKISKKSLATLRRAGVVSLCLPGHGYVCAQLDGKQWYLHRLLMTLAGHDLDGRCVDHKNGNKLDNLMSNLRVATPAENLVNAAANRKNTSGFKGVSFHKGARKWMAGIGSRPCKYLGLYDTPEAAANAYNAAAKKKYGKFAKLNCI